MQPYPNSPQTALGPCAKQRVFWKNPERPLSQSEVTRVKPSEMPVGTIMTLPSASKAGRHVVERRVIKVANSGLPDRPWSHWGFMDTMQNIPSEQEYISGLLESLTPTPGMFRVWDATHRMQECTDTSPGDKTTTRLLYPELGLTILLGPYDQVERRFTGGAVCGCVDGSGQAEESEYDIALDAIETVLLTQAIEGIDVLDDRHVKALIASVEILTNRYS